MAAPVPTGPPQTNTVKRGARTVTQGGAAYLFMEFIGAFNLVELTERQFGIVLVILTAVVSLIQNRVENHIGFGFLRPRTSDDAAVPGVMP